MKHLKKLLPMEKSIIAFMPIKPVYAEKIISGKKKYEFRKKSINPDITHIIIYATFPVKKIIGVAEVKRIHISSPSAIWEKTKSAAGIPRRLFREYFQDVKMAYAIELKKIIKLNNQIAPDEIKNGFNIPQSFSYVNAAFYRKVIHRGLM